MLARGPVIAAVDPQNDSDVVLRAAHRLARNSKTSLLVCAVREEVLRHAPAYPMTRDFEDRLQQADDARVAAALSERVQDVTGRPRSAFTLVQLAGGTTESIAGQVGTSSAELLVVGVGQRANAVARATQCPVLFARESPTGGILAASDLIDLQYPTLDAAQRIAQRRAARLCLFHAAGTRRGMTAARRRLRSEALARGAEAEVVTAPGDPLEAIVRQAQAMQAELLVIGSDLQRAASGGLSPLLSDQIIRRAPCSVLLVRKHQGQPRDLSGHRVPA